MNPQVAKNTGVPLYEQIQNFILSEISVGKLRPGGPVYSEHELAGLLNVSRLTVRRAYSELVRRNLLHSVHGKGTFVTEDADQHVFNATPAPQSRNGTSIAVVFPEVSRFFPPILHALEAAAARQGLHITLMFNTSVRAEDEAIGRVLNTPDIGGLVITPFRFAHDRSYSRYGELRTSGIPTVMIGKPPFHVHMDSVYCDDVAATYNLITSLVARGHRRIIWMTDSSGDIEGIAERREGYQRAMAGSGLEKMATVYEANRSDWERPLLDALQTAPKPTAVCCDNDITAARAMNLLLARGYRVPDDVSIVGFSDDQLCETLAVPLSSIGQPRRQMGESAFDLLYEQMAEPSADTSDRAHHIVYVPNLVERQSIRTFEHRE